MELKESALAIATSLAAVETAAKGDDMEAVRTELKAHHTTLKTALDEHAAELDFDDVDVEEIEAVGVAARGGTAKP